MSISSLLQSLSRYVVDEVVDFAMEGAECTDQLPARDA